MSKPHILLTNDDGIRSPGLWAAAAALSEIGFVHVAAPRQQYSGAGRSYPHSSDGIIQVEQVQVKGQSWTVHAVGGTPAQAVLYGVLDILRGNPDLVVSGINYGENVGPTVTVSGTVGAAMEAAGLGIPALAISLETEPGVHLSYSLDVDFSAAAHFAAYFGRMLLEKSMPPDVHLLKIEVPRSATPSTPWEITRQSMLRYFEPLPPNRLSWADPAPIGFRIMSDPSIDRPDTDVYSLRVKRTVSVTPLSLDLTSRVDMGMLDGLLRG